MTELNQQLVEAVAETLANQVGMRNGAPPIKGCLALMPPHMAEIFRSDALAAIQATDGECQRLRSALEDLLHLAKRLAASKVVVASDEPIRRAEAIIAE